MSSTRDLRPRARIAFVAALAAAGCGLERPPDPQPLDCASVDRAAERFPEECAGEAADAGLEDAGSASDAPGEGAP